uniref:G-protein coupled receptors family 1 profile domain-containing protein n=1 Tax=Arion vulgaris TaxID=1028688 RepID=A0A0B7BLC5_9EUPU
MSAFVDINVSGVANGNSTHAASNQVDSETLYHDNNITSTTNPRLVAGVVVMLFLILSLLGNSVVFYVYRFRFKPSVFSFYVTVLASLNITTALTTMIIDIIIKMRPLDENVLHLPSMCKITHFQVYSQSLISGSVLTLIAYQRYRKICHPLQQGLKLRTARRVLIVISVVCIIFTLPTFMFNGSQVVQVKAYNRISNVTICRYDKDYEGTNFPIIFSSCLLCAFVLVLFLLIIFYVMVAKAVRKFERRNSTLSSRAATSPVDIDMINKEQGFNVSDNENKQRRETYGRSQQPRESISSSGASTDGITRQMYRVFTIITVIFIVSYLPHLIVLILNKILEIDNKVLTFTEQLLLDLAYSCAYISTVANPIVYGFQNMEFREHLRHMLKCRG